MTNNNAARYAIVPVHYGPPPADAIMVGGPLSAIMENIPDSIARTDAIRAYQTARLDAAQIDQMQKATHALQVAAFCDSVNTISRRLDAIEARRTARLKREAKARKDDEARRVQEMLDNLPDPDDPNGPAFYPPGGELHEVAPPNTDNEGELPKDLLRATPPSPGNYPLDDPAELDEPPQSKYRPPVAVSLNEADEYDY